MENFKISTNNRNTKRKNETKHLFRKRRNLLTLKKTQIITQVTNTSAARLN